jgi:TolB protein
MIYKCICFFLFTALAWGSEQELVVRLETENQLTLIQFSTIEGSRAAFSKEYIQDLEKVLAFDLNHNGSTMLVDEVVFYRLTSEVQGRNLTVQLSSADEQETLLVGPVYLSGYLGEDRRVVHEAADAVHRALFGANGIASTRLLYTVRHQEEGKEYSEVWQADYDGANPKPLTEKKAGYCVTPSYVPPIPGSEADSFLYVSYETGIPKIYLASLKDGRGRKIFSLSGNQLMPTISRQRDQVALISDVTGNPDLFLQPFSPEKGPLGKPRHLYTAPYSTQGTPTFSPDGLRLAFVSNKGGSPRVYILMIPPVGTPLKEIQPVLITKVNRENTAPCWSPDGTKIAYCAKTKGVRQIWVYDLLTGVERQLTQGGQNKENPVWAPNSLHLVYNTSDAGKCQLYLINLKQAKAVKITDGAGDKRFPSWEPRSSL